jgi:hypothetical protein
MPKGEVERQAIAALVDRSDKHGVEPAGGTFARKQRTQMPVDCTMPRELHPERACRLTPGHRMRDASG